MQRSHSAINPGGHQISAQLRQRASGRGLLHLGGDLSVTESTQPLLLGTVLVIGDRHQHLDRDLARNLEIERHDQLLITDIAYGKPV